MWNLISSTVSLPLGLVVVLGVLLVIAGGFIFKNNPVKGAKTLDELKALGSSWLAHEEQKLKAKLNPKG